MYWLCSDWLAGMECRACRQLLVGKEHRQLSGARAQARAHSDLAALLPSASSVQGGTLTISEALTYYINVGKVTPS
jgi:hypothetical protein